MLSHKKWKQYLKINATHPLSLSQFFQTLHPCLRQIRTIDTPK